MRKVNVEICVGTTCFVLGASDLQELEQFLPEEIKGKVNITGSTCLGMCKEDNYGSAPFVKVNGEIIANADIGKVIDKIREKLKND